MFRPNRIGTPIIHNASFATGASWTPYSVALTAAPGRANIVNSAAQLDFGKDTFSFTGSATVGATSWSALMQQFTITKPISGDTAGLELEGCLIIDAPGDVTFIGGISKLVAPASTPLGAVSFSELVTPFSMQTQAAGVNGVTGKVPRVYNYKESVVVNESDFNATFGHGVLIGSTSAFTCTYFNATFAIRQLNDQQSVNYRDTRR